MEEDDNKDIVTSSIEEAQRDEKNNLTLLKSQNGSTKIETASGLDMMLKTEQNTELNTKPTNINANNEINTDSGEKIIQNIEPLGESSVQNAFSLDEKVVQSAPSSHDENYAKHIKYEEDGTAIYTDPKTNMQYSFSTKSNSWVPIENSANSEENPYENEHYRWDFETSQWIPKVQQGVEVKYSYEDGAHTYKDQDGTTFFYDETKKAWFPKIDDDFMAIYQLNYGFDADGNQKRKVVDDDGFKIPMSIKEKIAENNETKKNGEKPSLNLPSPVKAPAVQKRKAQQPPQWFDIPQEQNTKVYVSNLPLDTTEQEFVEIMGKCGLVMKDPQTQKFKIKLYTDSNGKLKGDGLCDYIKVESVDLALNILDGYDVRGNIINVQRAKFEMRGQYNPTLKPKKKKKEKEKLAKLKEKLFDWRPEKMRGERSKHERVVIIKNLFEPQIFDEKVELILEYQNDLREECNKCGTVRKVIIYDRHVDGVASISMSSPEEADLVVQMMNRRFYGKRRLIAEIWDGKTKYKSEETSREEETRLSKWDKFLESEDADKNTTNISVEENENASIKKISGDSNEDYMIVSEASTAENKE